MHWGTLRMLQWILTAAFRVRAVPLILGLNSASGVLV